MIRHKDEDAMGRFAVEVELFNYKDMCQAEFGALPPERVRRQRISGIVDTGATRLVITSDTAEALGLSPTNQSRVRYADGRSAMRGMAEGIYLQHGDRHGVFSAIIEPGRTEALIGAIVLEELDLVVDCVSQRLIPRDPHHLVSEVE